MSPLRVLVLLFVSCSPSNESKPVTPAASALATVSATVSAQAPATPPYVPSGAFLGTFPYTTRGYVVASSLPLRSKLQVYEAECVDDQVAGTFRCVATTGLLAEALKGNAQGSFDLTRTRACFDVDVRKADAAIVASIAKRDGTQGSDPQTTMKAGADELAARAKTEGPTLYLVRTKTHDASVACHCEGRDCCLGFHPTAAQRRAGTWSTRIFAQSSQPISVPFEQLRAAGTLPLYDGSPRARDVADFAKAGDWKSALALAKTEAADVPLDVRGHALANVAVCAFQARDMQALAHAVQEIEALGDRAHPYVRSNARLLKTAVNGEMWLDADPCVP